MRVKPLAPDSNDFNVSVVSFGDGVRNKFHYHESDQLLIVTEGKGVVVTEEGARAEVSEGDVVFAPAGEKHWHGALPGGSFAHITVTRKGSGDDADGGVAPPAPSCGGARPLPCASRKAVPLPLRGGGRGGGLPLSRSPPAP